MPGIICDIPDQSEDRIIGCGLGYYGRPISFRNLNGLRSVLSGLVRCTLGFIGAVTNRVSLFESALSVFSGLAENFTSVSEIFDLCTGRRFSDWVTDLDYAPG